MVKAYKNYFLAFFIPAFCMLFAYALNGIYPFGEKSVLTADLLSQYVDLTVNVAEQIKNSESIFITWKSGLGSNLYAMVLYVLASPLNLLFLLFDCKYYQEVYFVVILIKFGLIGLFSYIYFEKSNLTNKKSEFGLLLSLIYAVGIFSIKATINPMWMENIALLPLVFLGVERIIENKKVSLYFVSILMCFITNYYLSYITGIFTVLYFVYYYILSKKIILKEVFKSVFLFAVSTLLAIGVAAIILFPAWEGITNTYTEVFGVGNNGEMIRYNLKNILFIFLYIIDERATSGIANCYFGILPLSLAVFYFLNKKIAIKEKLLSIGYLMFFVLSLAINPLYLFWHLFRAPTGFDGRFLYGVVLFILIIGARSINKLGEISNKKIALASVLMFMALNYAMFGRITAFYAINAVLVMLAFVFYCAMLKKNTPRSIKLIKLVVIIECIIIAYMGVKVISDNDLYADREEYLQYQTEYKQEFDKVKSMDEGFYRMDSTKIRSYNSSMSMGYNGINHFSSLANQKCFYQLKKMGAMSFSDNKVLLNYGQNIVLDSLLGTKYTIAVDKTDKNKDSIGRELYTDGVKLSSNYYEKYFEDDTSIAYLNKTVFPIMFSASDKIKTLELKADTEYINIFENQSKFFNALFDNTEDLYTKYAFDSVKAAGAQVNVDEKGLMDIDLNNLPSEKIMATEVDEVGKVIFTFKVENSGNYFMCAKGEFPFNAIVNRIAWIMVNDISYRVFYMDNELIDMGYFEKGDTITLSFYNAVDTQIYLPAIFKLNDEVFINASNTANKNSLTDIYEEKGNIYAKSNFNDKRLVFSSIGYDEGFDIFVDDEKVDKICLANGFLGFEVPEGVHNIKITYISPGFIVGRNISAFATILAILFLFINERRRFCDK